MFVGFTVPQRAELPRNDPGSECPECSGRLEPCPETIAREMDRLRRGFAMTDLVFGS
jgi:hypothetical protein